MKVLGGEKNPQQEPPHPKKDKTKQKVNHTESSVNVIL